VGDGSPGEEGCIMRLNLPSIELSRAIAFDKPDIVRRFLAWAQSADDDARAEGASALARAYLHSDLIAPMRAEAALALTALTDDRSILVRRALAGALARASDAPRAVILALAADELEAAAPVLLHSPVLTDEDLVDLIAIGDTALQTIVARRPNLPPRAKTALAETGGFDAILALIGNLAVDLPDEWLEHVFDRFGDDTRLRDALLERPALPAALRVRIAILAAEDLALEVAQWMAPARAERVAREARNQALSTIASSCRPEERTALVSALRTGGALTPSLLLRSLLGGERGLFAAALMELSGLPFSRVAGFLLEPRGQGFGALARRCGLKASLLPPFWAALEAIKAQGPTAGEGLKLPLVQAVIDECERLDDPALIKVRALLWRFAAEAAKAEAASYARGAATAPASRRLPPALTFSPFNDDGDGAPKLIADFSRAPPLELVANPASPVEDRAPRVELRPETASRLDDAA
jgi:uncharacterized protein (DUF2336 family)